MNPPEPHDLAPFVENAPPHAIVNHLKLVDDRDELMERIGREVGFHVEQGRDRLTKDELAQIAVWILARQGKL